MPPRAAVVAVAFADSGWLPERAELRFASCPRFVSSARGCTFTDEIDDLMLELDELAGGEPHAAWDNPSAQWARPEPSSVSITERTNTRSGLPAST
jgi:hypothetical protein